MTGPAAQIVLLPPGFHSRSVVCKRCSKEASPRYGYFGSIVAGELPETVSRLTRRYARGHANTFVVRPGIAPRRHRTSGAERTMNYSEARGRRRK
jgi:hypothetical protein